MTYVAFIIDVFSRRIVGWRVSTSIGAAPSIGSVGDPIDNAVAESTIGLFKNELIRRRGPWRQVDDVEFATLGYVDWFDNRRLHS